MLHRRSLSGLAVAVSAGMLLCACGKDKSAEASTTTSAPASAAQADPEMLKTVEEHLAVVYKGTEREPPSSAPKPMPGKNVWILSPGQAGDSASIAVNAVKEAGEAIGWKMTIFDGQGDASRYAVGIRQAVAAKADAIIDDSIDCAWIRQPLIEAHAAKVKLVSFSALDCNDPNIKGEPLFDGMVSFSFDYQGKTVTDFASLLRLSGMARADWVISQTKGLAKVIQFKEDEFLVLKYIREGFENELALCKSCQIVKTVDFTLADFGGGLAQKTQGAILQHPEANAMMVPYDTAMLVVAPAVRDSGRGPKLAVMGGEGFPTNMQLIRDSRGQDAAAAYSSPWIGWASVDTLNSVFHGEAPHDSGIGTTLVDRTHNLPPAGKGYETKKDFRAAYLKAWGISK